MARTDFEVHLETVRGRVGGLCHPATVPTRSRAWGRRQGQWEGWSGRVLSLQCGRDALQMFGETAVGNISRPLGLSGGLSSRPLFLADCYGDEMAAAAMFVCIRQSQGGLRTESCSGRCSGGCLQGAFPFTRVLCNKHNRSRSCSSLHAEMQPPTQVAAALSELRRVRARAPAAQLSFPSCAGSGQWEGWGMR